MCFNGLEYYGVDIDIIIRIILEVLSEIINKFKFIFEIDV